MSYSYWRGFLFLFLMEAEEENTPILFFASCRFFFPLSFRHGGMSLLVDFFGGKRRGREGRWPQRRNCVVKEISMLLPTCKSASLPPSLSLTGLFYRQAPLLPFPSLFSFSFLHLQNPRGSVCICIRIRETWRFFAFAFKLDVRDFALFRSVKKEGEVLSAGYSLPCTLKQIFLQTKKTLFDLQWRWCCDIS